MELNHTLALAVVGHQAISQCRRVQPTRVAPAPRCDCRSVRDRVKDACGATARSAAPIRDPSAPLPGLPATGSREARGVAGAVMPD